MFILILSAYLPIQAQDQSDFEALIEMLKEDVPKQMASKNVPGMAMAVFDKGQVVFQSGFGFADISKQSTINENTGFNIGSISKMFTAWGVMHLVERGKVDLDKPVETYLKSWKIPSSEFDNKKITVRALLSHTAGLSVHGYGGYSPDEELPSLVASLNGDRRADERVEVILEPLTQFKYSGGGYSILQLMIEDVSELPFEKYMERQIFKPLKMTNTTFKITKKVLKSSAKPYDEAGNEIYLERFTAKAAAGLQTNLQDLIKFAKATFNGSQVLSKDVLSKMQKPLAVTKGRYGLGYMTYPMGPVQMVGHAGSNDGWESAFLFDFTENSGLIMLTNGSLGKDVAINTMRKWVMWKQKARR
ncbi:serine hydrolase domain-containing protein [Roseivirga misakiensis]|uniref:serine hydrolase domain-containing protein n=1 Tax=Roseivirga misakiensis TaxID=1563681 RepID=UPI00159F2F9A|nr:serine hydrolase domain-containing protein [Roseivirga misakiensis]